MQNMNPSGVQTLCIYNYMAMLIANIPDQD